MKKIIPLATAIFAITLGVTSCKTDKKEAQEEVVEATGEQVEATVDYEQAKAADTSDYAVLKAGTKKMIADNDKRIAEFRLKLTDETAENRKKLNVQIDKLEAKNNKLRTSLDSFGEKTGEKWDAFKTRVKKSVDDIDKDINDYKKEHNYD